MAKFNALLELSKRSFTAIQNKIAIMALLPLDNDLYDFIEIQAKFLLFTEKGITNPSIDELTMMFATIVDSMAECPLGASKVYDKFLDGGESALIAEMARLSLIVNGEDKVG